jgi:CBS domain-containing protein
LARWSSSPATALQGIVSERDYARKVILQGKQSQTTPVREIMTTPVLYVTPQHTVDQCLRLMTTRHVRHLPVLDGESIAGVLSIGDLVEFTIRGHKQMIHQLENYIAGAYPG